MLRRTPCHAFARTLAIERVLGALTAGLWTGLCVWLVALLRGAIEPPAVWVGGVTIGLGAAVLIITGVSLALLSIGLSRLEAWELEDG